MSPSTTGAFARLGDSRGWVINAEHRLLLQALRDGDVVSAQHVLVGHIQRTRRRPEVFDRA